MAINQLSTSNTFQHWLIATQALIEKYNRYENTTNLVFDTANSVYEHSNTVNVKTDLVINLTELTYNNYNATYNLANSVYETSNTVNATANIVFAYVDDGANTINNSINLAYQHIEIFTNNTINTIDTTANNLYEYVNVAYTQANNAYNLANQSIETVYTITDDTANNIDIFPMLSVNVSGIPSEAYVSSTKLYYNPSSGTLSSVNFNSLSDIFYKKNILSIDDSLSVVRQMDGVRFNWKDTNKISYGVIAQQLENIVPELVDGVSKKTVNYSGIIAFLINAIKELDKKINILESKMPNKEE